MIPGAFAPVIVRSGRSARKVIRPMHMGYPAPSQSTELSMPRELRWVPFVRNLASPFWIGNLRHSGLRCLIPLTAFTLNGSKRDRWRLHCTLADRAAFAVAGIWRDLTDMPVFAMLVTPPCAALLAKADGRIPASMPAILPAGSEDRWLDADWQEVEKLIRPYVGHDLRMENL